MPRRLSLERRQALAVTCGMIGLAIAGPALGNTFDGVYTGQRLLTKGPTPPCSVREDVSVTIADGTLSFANNALQDFTISFDPHLDGSFDETYADAGGAFVDIRGRVAGDLLDADVTNTPCEHHWHLTKKSGGQ